MLIALLIQVAAPLSQTWKEQNHPEMPSVIATTVPSKASGRWEIIRQDGKEFCSNTVTTWNLNTGEIKKELGGCDPNRHSPPLVSLRQTNVKDLNSLRELADLALLQGLSIVPCHEHLIKPFPGPFFTVRKGQVETSPNDCYNEIAFQLDKAMKDSIK